MRVPIGGHSASRKHARDWIDFTKMHEEIPTLAWAKLTKDKMAAARKGRLRTLAHEASVGGPLRSDAAYMESATASGHAQAGNWAGVVPASGTRVRFRRCRLGLLYGAAQMVARRTHSFESARQDLPNNALDCPQCGPGVMESFSAPGPGGLAMG